jgi:hypothetical protein
VFLHEIERKQQLFIAQQAKLASTRKRKKSGKAAKVVVKPPTPASLWVGDPSSKAADVLEDIEVVAPDPTVEPPKPPSMFAVKVTAPLTGEAPILENKPLVIPEEEPVKIIDVITKMIGVPVPVDLHTRMSAYLKRHKGKTGPQTLKALAVRSIRIGFEAIEKS